MSSGVPRLADPVSVMVVGPGALGCLFAGRLYLAGHRVALLDHRPERASRMAREGIELDGQTVRLPVSAHAADVSMTERLIICVKSYSTASVARQIRPYIKREASILSIQNGIGNAELLSPLTNRAVWAAVTHCGARKLASGAVIQTGAGATWLAPFGDLALNDEGWSPLLRSAGFDVSVHPSARTILWSKLVVNAAINPLSALYHLTNGEVPVHLEAGALGLDVIGEAVAVAHGLGIEMDEAALIDLWRETCAKTADNHSSMRVDYERGGPTEVEQITGAIVAAGRGVGIATPVNEMLLSRVLAG